MDSESTRSWEDRAGNKHYQDELCLVEINHRHLTSHDWETWEGGRKWSVFTQESRKRHEWVLDLSLFHNALP